MKISTPFLFPKKLAALFLALALLPVFAGATARVDVPKTSISATPAAATYTSADASNNHSFRPPSGCYVIHFKNTDTNARTVTFVSTVTMEGLALPNRAITIPLSSERFLGSLNPALFLDTTTGLISFNVDSATGFSFAVVDLH